MQVGAVCDSLVVIYQMECTVAGCAGIEWIESEPQQADDKQIVFPRMNAAVFEQQGYPRKTNASDTAVVGAGVLFHP